MKVAHTVAIAALLTILPVYVQAEDGDGRNVINQAQELPQGLAIVPWKKTPAEALEEGPVRLVEEPLRSIDPEVFRRQLGLDSPPSRTQP